MYFMLNVGSYIPRYLKLFSSVNMLVSERESMGRGPFLNGQKKGIGKWKGSFSVITLVYIT